MKILFLISFSAFVLFSHAQEKHMHPKNKNMKSKIDTYRIGLITEKLDLTSGEAEKFWPVYNELTKQKNDIQKDFMSAKRSFNYEEASDEEHQQLMDLNMKTKEDLLKLEKTYNDRLGKILSVKKLNQLKMVEHEFRYNLMKKVRMHDDKMMPQRGMKQGKHKMKNKESEE